jgi:dolichol-phosphate mannosyltransferase
MFYRLRSQRDTPAGLFRALNQANASDMNQIELIAVMPVYNEGANITSVVTEWLNAFRHERIKDRLITVNDGSTDNTLSILQHLQAQSGDRLLVLDKPNSGHGRSCRVGYETALQSGAPWVFQIDSDGQCDPAFFRDFWAERKEADCVFGRRISRGDGAVRRLIQAATRLLTMIATGRDLKDANVPYRLIKREALHKALQRVPSDFDMQNVALTFALKRDPSLRWAYVPIRFRARQGGINSINLSKIIKMGWQMLMEINRVGKASA